MGLDIFLKEVFMNKVNGEISSLDGFINTKMFFEKHDTRKLSNDNLRQLLLRISTLNTHVELSAFISIVKSELESRDAHRNFLITTTIAIIALITSIRYVSGISAVF